jgi:hypothetical protein
MVAWAAASCAAPTAPPETWQVMPLRNAGFEEGDAQGCPRGWGCKMHANPHSYRFVLDDSKPGAGKHSVCVEPAAPEPWAMLTQVLHEVPKGARLRISALLRVEGGSDKGVGPYIAAQGGAGRVIRHATNAQQGAFEWKRVESELDVPAEATLLEFGVVFYKPVRACVDDVRLEIRRAPPV